MCPKYHLDKNDKYAGTDVPIREVLNSIIHEKTSNPVRRIYKGTQAQGLGKGYIDLWDIAIPQFTRTNLDRLRNDLERYGKVAYDWRRWRQAGL